MVLGLASDQLADASVSWVSSLASVLAWKAYTHPFNGPFSGTTRVGRYQKGTTNLDFTEARDSEWQWPQLGICKSAPRSRQITTPAPHHSFLQAGCPSCRPTNSVKALKEQHKTSKKINISQGSVATYARCQDLQW